MMALGEYIDTITDLLLGAAYADKRLEGKEVEAIRSMLCTLLDTADLPEAQDARIKAFNPAKHDAKAAARSLAGLAEEYRHTLVKLVASVAESDDELDLAEDAYVRTVAEGLGLSEDEIAALTLEVEELDGLRLE